MSTESEIQNFKKKLLNEVVIELDKKIDKFFEKATNTVSSEKRRPLLVEYYDEIFFEDPALSCEENIKNRMCFIKSLIVLNKRCTKVRDGATV